MLALHSLRHLHVISNNSFSSSLAVKIVVFVFSNVMDSDDVIMMF